MPKLIIAVLFLALAVTGCMNLTTRLQADDVTVKETHEGNDCVSIILGIGIGTATVEAARSNGKSPADAGYAGVPLYQIQKIRRLQFSDYQFWGFGARCIEVTGEGSDIVKTSAR